jgi:hypothetical protein
MPSAGKSVVELVTSDGRHVTWVEVNSSERNFVRSLGQRSDAISAPVILLWGTRMFVWRTVSQAGFFVFAEATVLVSRTPSPGLESPDGAEPSARIFSPEVQERLAEQVRAVSFRGSVAPEPSPEGWCLEGSSPKSECACSRCRLERGEPAL